MKITAASCLFLCLMMFAGAAEVRAAGPYGCPPWRPCGPGNSFGGNRLIAQGFGGANFRPSCATHDACLASGASRRECDRRFLGQMNAACDCSRHPFLCRMKALQFYAGARLFGGLYY